MHGASAQFTDMLPVSGVAARPVSTSRKGVIFRTFAADAVNALVNHPEIRPFIGGEGQIDLAEAVARPENWFLLGEHGGFALVWSAPGVHEVHTFILESGRGRWARAAAASGIRFAVEHGDWMLWTKIPPGQPNVANFAVGMGMRPTGMTIETFGKPYQAYMMEIGECQRQQ